MIGRLALKNRLIMGAHGHGGECEPDGRMTYRGIDYYVARARGGTGLITTGWHRVSRVIEQLSIKPLVRNFMIDNYLAASRLSELADAVHDYGAKLSIQLFAGHGRVAKPVIHDEPPVAPSPVPWFSNPNVLCRELTTKEIDQLVADFEKAAEMIKTAGIDAIELNAHNGYLMDQFMTPKLNQRNDKYGDLLIFPVEVIAAIKRGAGADFPIIFKFALGHKTPGGREVEEGLAMIPGLEAAGIAAIGVDIGSYETYHYCQPPTTQPPGLFVYLAEMTKKIAKIPVIAIGKLGDPALAESVLREGKADFVQLTRPLLADPEWPNKVREGLIEDICPCIGDHEGCVRRLEQRKYVSCTVNPQAMMEKEFVLKPAERRKKVLVVGGGPAGMEAARVSALRGHNVTLFEKNNALGGNLIPGSVPDFKGEYRQLLDYLTTRTKKAGITIELGREATPELVQQMRPDVVLVATGAMPCVPAIPGVDRKHVATGIDILLGKKEARKNVVIIGGGLVGSEIALYLARMGKKVSIVEVLPEVAGNMWQGNHMHLVELLKEAEVKMLTETNVLEIKDRSVIVVDKYEQRNELESDTAVLAAGLKPNNRLEQALKGKVKELYAIGDCVEAGKLLNAIWGGFRIARLI